MKRIALYLLCLFFSANLFAQGGYTVTRYHVDVLVNKDASLNITEVIQVHFSENRHGIYRMIPFKYRVTDVGDGTTSARQQMKSGGFTKTIVEDIKVPGWNYEVSNEGGYKKIKIGDKDIYISGDQEYVISYRLLNAINFFTNYSELYFNIIGDKWDTRIDSVTFSVNLYEALPAEPPFFVATGSTGSKADNTITGWKSGKTLSGYTTIPLLPGEGLTVGIRFPENYLVKQNYALRGVYWLTLPVIIFLLMFAAWRRWGKDADVTITTAFYPPANANPSVAGYIIDDRLNRRDLTALIPYWGAGGYLRIEETQETSFLGLIKETEYEFIKLKDLPATAYSFEKTLFNGLFKSGDRVALSSLKDVFYQTMNKARKDLVNEVDKGAYYVKYSRGLGCGFFILGILFLVPGIFFLINTWGDPVWLPVSLLASAVIIFLFAAFMAKKSPLGNELYKELAGFKEFIKKVEKDKLQLFLKEDEHYFDKVLPFAIVFNMADTWKDKLKGLEIPPPTWYAGSYQHYNSSSFLNSLDKSMNAMSSSFYSTPSSSGSSGGSWGGGGSSGGGFGGGGGGSW